VNVKVSVGVTVVAVLPPVSGDVIGLAVGGVVSVPMPVTIREMVSPSAAKAIFAVAVADAVGVKRTVAAWVAPRPTRLNGLPETMLKGAETDTLPERVPPLVFDTVSTRSAKLPTLTLLKSTVPIGLTANSMRATALPKEVAQVLSLPLSSTAVTETKYEVPAESPVSLRVTIWLGGGLSAKDATSK